MCIYVNRFLKTFQMNESINMTADSVIPLENSTIQTINNTVTTIDQNLDFPPQTNSQPEIEEIKVPVNKEISPISQNGKIPPNTDNDDAKIFGLCIKSGCSKPAVRNTEWEDEYCSNECVVSHCR